MATADEYRERLERAGWSVREVPPHASGRASWAVLAEYENVITGGFGATLEEAWQVACRRAEALGLLPPE